MLNPDNFKRAIQSIDALRVARILIIDDDSVIRMLISRILTAMGHAVTTAADGAEGLRANRATPFELVITDLVMPEKEGCETIMELRRTHPQVRIVAMSGGANLGLVLANLKAASLLGAVKTLQKPFTVEELIVAVNEALNLDIKPSIEDATPTHSLIELTAAIL